MSSGTLGQIQGVPWDRPSGPGTGAEGPLGDKGGITNKDEEQD